MAENSVGDGALERIAFDLWDAVGGKPENDKSMAAVQRSLLLYVECLKAIEGARFDVTKIT